MLHPHPRARPARRPAKAARILPTAHKLDWLRGAHAAGLREIEVGSFVPAPLLPQQADTAEQVAFAKTLPGLVSAVPVPNLKGAARAFETGADALPKPGDHLVVLDIRDRPRAIVRNSHVERRHFDEIDDDFAFEAGEGDLTLRWWPTAHRQDFAERAEREGFQVGERVVLILEYFERVWPAAADG